MAKYTVPVYITVEAEDADGAEGKVDALLGIGCHGEAGHDTSKYTSCRSVAWTIGDWDETPDEVL